MCTHAPQVSLSAVRPNLTTPRALSGLTLQEGTFAAPVLCFAAVARRRSAGRCATRAVRAPQRTAGARAGGVSGARNAPSRANMFRVGKCDSGLRGYLGLSACLRAVAVFGAQVGVSKSNPTRSHPIPSPPCSQPEQLPRNFLMRLLAAISAAAALATAAATLRKGHPADVLDAASGHPADVLDAAWGGLADGCNGEGGKCSKNSDCCDPYVCNSEGKCKPCYQPSYACADTGQCCSPYVCSSGKHTTCVACYEEGYNCAGDNQCCSGTSCLPDGKCSACQDSGASCDSGADCCSGSCYQQNPGLPAYCD
jgi:hypothetical protein